MVWKLKDIDISLSQNIQKNFNIKRPIAEFLVTRGIKSLEEADFFINPHLSKIPHPDLMKDLKKAVDRLISAIKKREKIAIYGDYDADGITACALLVLFLRDIGADVTYYIPDRINEGYGLNISAIDKLKEKGVSLIITVDCGIRDFSAVDYANNLGLDIVITDHHLPEEKLPNTIAVINPKRKDCSFPYKELAGVGVAFYLLIELRTQLRKLGVFNNRKEPNLREYLDIVAIGTIADMVPLIGPNRIFVKYGLEEINKTKKRGLKILREDLLIDTLDVRSISFRMAPRINASGRVSSPLEALNLLLTSDEEKAKELVKSLNDSNKKRQSLVEKALTSAIKMMEDMEEQFIYCLYSSEWHQGILGIIASKLMEKFNRPFIVFTDAEEGLLKGSARSVESLPLDIILEQTKHLLVEYGGHKLACGLSISKGNLPTFSKVINDIVKKTLKEPLFCNYIEIDSEIFIDEIDNKFFEDIKLLEPFGFGNEEPIFLLKDVDVVNARSVGSQENHLKLYLKKANTFFNAIGFSLSNNGVSENSKLDLIGIPKITEYNGQKRWDFYIRDYEVKR